MTADPCQIAVCVPVRDEAARLPALLAALERCASIGSTHRLSLCFFLDGCTDASERILREAAGHLSVPIVLGVGAQHAAGNVGRARHEAMRLGLERVGTGERSFLLSTDADSAPRPDWIAAAIDALAQAEVATGVIVRQEASANRLQDRLEAYYDRLHEIRRRIDPVPWETDGGHHFVGGANLAFRAGAYAALGGFPPLSSGEDAALVDDAGRAGMRVRRARAMIVTTSSRRTGRTPGGLAGALRQLDRDGYVRVPDPTAAIWQYRAQAAARRLFPMIADAEARAAFGLTIGLDADHVLGVARDCPNAQAFALRVVPAAPFSSRELTLAEAEAILTAIDHPEIERAA